MTVTIEWELVLQQIPVFLKEMFNEFIENGVHHKDSAGRTALMLYVRNAKPINT